MENSKIEAVVKLVEEVGNQILTEKQALTKIEKLAKNNKERIQLERVFKSVQEILAKKDVEFQREKEDFYSDQYLDMSEDEEYPRNSVLNLPINGIMMESYEDLHLWCYTQFTKGVYFNEVYWTLINSFKLSHMLALYFTKEGLNTYQVSTLDLSKENIERLKYIIDNIHSHYEQQESSKRARSKN